jgi:hypothetical protein
VGGRASVGGSHRIWWVDPPVPRAPGSPWLSLVLPSWPGVLVLRELGRAGEAAAWLV